MSEEENNIWIYAPCPECGYNNGLEDIPCEGQKVIVFCDKCGLIYPTKMPEEKDLRGT